MYLEIRRAWHAKILLLMIQYSRASFLHLAVIGTLIPHKKKAVIRLVTSAMIAGNTACFITAAIAGLFYQSNPDASDFP